MPARKSERSTGGSSEKSATNGGIHLKKAQSTKTKRKPTQKKSNSKLEKTSLVENITKEVKLGGSSSGNVRKTGSSQINGSSVAERTFQHFAGCHVSAAGGVDNAIKNALDVNAKSFALFLRNQRSWTAKPLDLEVAARFKELCVQHNFPPHLIIPHGSYLVNLGSPSIETREKSILTFIDELN
ncbi:uncharacterized protein LOC111716566, partial [Eurytemora carolleeae]|uniref:uncharacterized protein LOC111716566 n=1 Tax=Eurytemora carolleeae TaxID=1294199 RepID=UPI000C79457B